MSKKLIIFIDSGDTIVNEETQIYNDRGIVAAAQLIPGAKDNVRRLHEEGFTITLVADGEWEAFENVYGQHQMMDCFDVWSVSSAVGVEKPEPAMFTTAMEKLSLTEEDKPRIVMIGNNLKKDIAGANRMGLTSIWLDWSPRYFHTVEEADWKPDYTVSTHEELYALIYELEEKLHNA